MDAREWPETEDISTRNGKTLRLKYRLVLDVAELDALADWLCEQSLFAWDTETSGLNPAQGARVIGHAFAAVTAPNEITGWYVPMRHQDIEAVQGALPLDGPPIVQLPVEQVTAAVARILTSKGMCVAHNGKFDRKMARADGVIPTRSFIDTALEAIIFDENQPSFALKNLAVRHCVQEAKDEQTALEDWMRKDARDLGMPYKKAPPSDPEALTYMAKYAYSRTPIPLCGRYAIRDVFYTLYLHIETFRNVQSRYPALWEREHRVADILCEMEWHGLPADATCIRDTAERTKAAADHWLEQIREIVGVPDFEPNDANLRALFYTALKMTPPKYTKGGKKAKSEEVDLDDPTKGYSVDGESREILAQAYPQHAPLLNAVEQHATVEKLHSTYAKGYLRFYSETTRSIHPSYNQIERRDKGGVPVTGRLSSSDPNSQNVSGRTLHLWNCGCRKCDSGLGPEQTVSVRRYFTVPSERVRIFIDFSQIELRVLAWFCQDPMLLRAYQNDEDVHQIVADELGISRKVSKQVNFGNSYGMSEIGLAKRLPDYSKDPEGRRVEAKAVLEAYFARYRRIREFRVEFANQMRRAYGQFVNPFGRPRRISEINEVKRWLRERAERMMMSSIISGTAADIMKESMIRTAGRGGVLERECPEGRLVQTIHDELVFDLPTKPGWASVVLSLVAAMEDWPLFAQPSEGRQGVPIKVSVEYSTTTWEEKRPLKIVGGLFAAA